MSKVKLSKKVNAELSKEVNASKKKILALKLQASVSGLEKPHVLKNLKKEIARALSK
jgi:ribosomal protein L29